MTRRIMDKNIIYDRIGRLQEWTQKESVNYILLDTFLSLNAYIEGRFDALSEAIENEAIANSAHPVIITAVCSNEDADHHLSLYPVSVNPPINSPEYITTIFLECDYPMIKQILCRTYTAEIITDTGPQTVQVALRYSQKYLQKVQALYYAFSENEIPWTTVNGVYFYKFFDIYCTQKTDEEITGFTSIDFGQYESFVSYDKVLLWNVNAMAEKTSGIAKPVGNAIQYEHSLRNLPFDEYQFLVCPMGERFTCFQQGKQLIVRTDSKELTQIELLRICGSKGTDGDLYLPPRSNRKEIRFSAGLAQKQSRAIPTRGEAERIVRSLQDETGLRLADVKLLPHTEDNATRYEGIDFNFFMEENAFLEDKKPLLFSFYFSGDNLFAHETMFFVLSELQLYFYEYRCVGELL